MCDYKILLYPCYQMIFKGSFDNLMKKVGRDELINICTWKVICERLCEIKLDLAMWLKIRLEQQHRWYHKQLVHQRQ